MYIKASIRFFFDVIVFISTVVGFMTIQSKHLIRHWLLAGRHSMTWMKNHCKNFLLLGLTSKRLRNNSTKFRWVNKIMNLSTVLGRPGQDNIKIEVCTETRTERSEVRAKWHLGVSQQYGHFQVNGTIWWYDKYCVTILILSSIIGILKMR